MGELGAQLEGLTAKQQAAVRLFAKAAVENAKLSFRAGVAGSRRSNTFDLFITTIL